MYVQIQTIDGQVFQSDPTDIVSSGLNPVEWDRAMGELTGILEEIGGDATFLALEIGERTRYFNPKNIVWAEIVN